MTINWSVSDEDEELIGKIVDRVESIIGTLADRATLVMDLTACHANGNPLDLVGLLDARPFDFSHDVFGIAHHINRNTGKLENCFVPRFTKREKAQSNESPVPESIAKHLRFLGLR